VAEPQRAGLSYWLVGSSSSRRAFSFHPTAPHPILRYPTPLVFSSPSFYIASVLVPEIRDVYDFNATIMDDDDAYCSFEHRHREAGSERELHFPILQPQFRQSTRFVPTRDRYRATQYGNFGHDDVEDDGPFIQDEGIQFDSFGMLR
jgi:hypothetical protein